MNKTLTPTEVKDLMATTKVPVLPTPRTLTRYDKLMIWAAAVASYPRQLTSFHGLELIAPHDYTSIRWSGKTIFDLGHKEPVLVEAGLTSSDIKENCQFFDIDPAELHYLSCDCHGEVSNEMVAHRMSTLASMKPGEFAATQPQPIAYGIVGGGGGAGMVRRVVDVEMVHVIVLDRDT